MPTLTERLDRLLYPGIGLNWDDRAFRDRILRHLEGRPTAVLDLGAGAGVVDAAEFRKADHPSESP